MDREEERKHRLQERGWGRMTTEMGTMDTGQGEEGWETGEVKLSWGPGRPQKLLAA